MKTFYTAVITLFFTLASYSATTPVFIQFNKSCLGQNYMNRLMIEFKPSNSDVSITATSGTILDSNIGESERYLEDGSNPKDRWKQKRVLNINSANLANQDIGTMAIIIGAKKNFATLKVAVDDSGIAGLADSTESNFRINNNSCSVNGSKNNITIKCTCKGI